MPLIWDKRIDQANVKARLNRLGLPKAAIYALGCATHSRDVVLTSHQQPLHPTFLKAARLLDDFWTEYPESIEKTAFQNRLEIILDILPDEEQRVTEYPFAEDTWIDGIAAAFELAAMDDYSERAALYALNAVDRAYIFVYTFHHELDGMNKTEAEIRAVESQSKFCVDEIEFQLGLLSVIESSHEIPPNYAEM
ncbi:MAG: hypothetical protein KDA84_29105, partial [Planctomycetaceae bacterium]|nr:hypothetical protein [Planctomycetaceae bacterium]